VFLWLALALPEARGLLEDSMTLHMLVQMPLLALTGALAIAAVEPSLLQAISRFNELGVAGTVVAMFASAIWMLPRSLDGALASTGYEAAKFLTLPILVGAVLRLSWHPLGAIGRGFVISNGISMLTVLGWLYWAAPVRLCNLYLTGEQERAGAAMLLVSAAALILWFLAALVGFPNTERKR